MENLNIHSFENDLEVDEVELALAKRKFNFGAFVFSWVWGLGNGSFHKTWPVLIIEPILFILMAAINSSLTTILFYALHLPFSIYFGLNGSKWAFDNRAWWSLSDFKDTQHRWTVAAIIICAMQAIAMIFNMIINYTVSKMVAP